MAGPVRCVGDGEGLGVVGRGVGLGGGVTGIVGDGKAVGLCRGVGGGVFIVAFRFVLKL